MVETSFVIMRRAPGGHYLQWHPATATWEFTAAAERFATPVTRTDADRLLAWVTARGEAAALLPDRYERMPEKDLAIPPVPTSREVQPW